MIRNILNFWYRVTDYKERSYALESVISFWRVARYGFGSLPFTCYRRLWNKSVKAIFKRMIKRLTCYLFDHVEEEKNIIMDDEGSFEAEIYCKRCHEYLGCF